MNHPVDRIVRVAAASLVAALVLAPLRAFNRGEVIRRAQTLAASPYANRASDLSESLRQLTYDEYRMIQFDERRTLWAEEGLPFRVQFFHPGFVHDRTVQVSQLVTGEPLLIPFETGLFRYHGQFRPAHLPRDLGFSGFRISHPLNSTAKFDELAAFQGASYFRALGQGQRYGLSARGLSIDTGASRPEEFPLFTEFWIERPAKDARQVVVHALMESPSATGAFQFTLIPGPSTTVEVELRLFLRAGAEVGTFGFAPLTSMFWHGESSATVNNDYRPEVHDSDGLMIHRGNGEWIWRPLSNPRQVRTVSFADRDPRGFGLVQRDRRFASYEDLEACYHLRPSAWVKPRGDWGRGELRLVEIPTADETNDNIVAFWVPEEKPVAGRAFDLSYQLVWYMETEAGSIHPPAGRAVGTRLGRSRTHEPELQRVIVDFGHVAKREGGGEVEAVLDVGTGAQLVHQGLQWNPFNETWRLAFALKRDGSGRPVELRAFLRQADDGLTETWTYLWQPD